MVLFQEILPCIWHACLGGKVRFIMVYSEKIWPRRNEDFPKLLSYIFACYNHTPKQLLHVLHLFQNWFICYCLMDHHQQFVTCLDGVLSQRLLALEKDKPVSVSSNPVTGTHAFSSSLLFYCFLHSFINFEKSEHLEP